MRYATTAVSFVMLTCVVFQTAHAQVDPYLNINVIASTPQNDFDRTLGKEGLGFGLAGGIGFRNTPIAIGVDLGFLVYGIERRREPLSLTIPDIRVDVSTTNNIFNAHFVTKYQHRKGTFRPYAEGLVGLKYLFTSTSIEGSGDLDDDGGLSDTNFDDTALSYGFGAGVDVQLWQGPTGAKKRMITVLLNGGVRYLWGSTASYLRKGAITRGEGAYTVAPSRSTTDLLVPQLGVAFVF